jgi:hypothetical protein
VRAYPVRGSSAEPKEKPDPYRRIDTYSKDNGESKVGSWAH